MMDSRKKNVCLLYRQPLRFFSIERVFRQLEKELEKTISVDRWIAPDGRATPLSILRNLLAVKKNRTDKKNKADIFHITGDIHYMALALPRDKTLLTIHDCVFLYRSSGLKRLLLKWLFLDWPVKHCRLVTTISEATRKDILRFTKCDPGKVVVIPDPLDEGIRYVPRPFFEQEPVLLFIGSRPNKNLEKAVRALEGIPCRLEIIGNPSPAAMTALSECKIKYRQRSGLSDSEVADSYAAADLVLFPSTFEGFGLPIIEAQQAGRPVITSDLSPMKEVAGGSACLVDPYDTGSIRSAVLRLISDAPYREFLVQKGRENVRRFDVNAIAQQYLDCYQKLENGALQAPKP